MDWYQAVVKTEHSEPAYCDIVLDTTDQMVDNSDYSAEQDGYQYEQNYGGEQDMYEEEINISKIFFTSTCIVVIKNIFLNLRAKPHQLYKGFSEKIKEKCTIWDL